MIKMLDIFENVYYGDYGCSRCGHELNGRCLTVGEVEDEEGYKWRAFCKDCEPSVRVLEATEIYSKYKVAPYME